MTSPRPDTEREAPGRFSPGASPLLDIGDDVGAVVVYLDECPPTGEIEAEPQGRPGERFHTGVHPLVTSGDTVQVAVFPEVAQGGYVLLDDDGSPRTLVEVTGGRVTEVDLRSA
jgi:hypothetical protein